MYEISYCTSCGKEVSTEKINARHQPIFHCENPNCPAFGKEVAQTKAEVQTAQENHEAAALRELLTPTMHVYTVLKHVSSSGMTRHISCIIAVERDGKPEVMDISWSVAKVLGRKCADDGGVIVGGCGMDTGFHLVYSLSRRLFREGFKCLGKDCHANDHFNYRNCDKVL